ncbi:nitrilase-related carbon-nitrogen hydrolase [Kitasatospora sp. NPDC085879]|uniref:nitrilase-related carbon-nitrogen hydrolase n=1 Tax=Kitasatospora sp. NPDC085879 TaxID=3154769 RepID=UPI003436EA56
MVLWRRQRRRREPPVPDSAVTVACCQVPLAVAEPARNWRVLREAVEQAASAGADVVVLPELANSGYVFRDRAEAEALAETTDGPTVAEWADLADDHRLVIVGGLCERDAEGRLRNTAVIVDPSGLRAVCHKAHLWGAEKQLFVAGDELPVVVETAVGRIGAMVCYDLEFPEWVRVAALQGTQLLCAPANWPRFPRPTGERPSEIVRVQADAAVNRMFIAVCDRVGDERGTRWTGGSVVAGPDGFLAAGPVPDYGSGIVMARCDLAEAQDKRLGEHNHVLSDRRPELYRSLVI